jgi:hypothetical protein
MALDYLYLDLLAQRTAEEIGACGGEATRALGFALAVTWDKREGFRHFTTEQRDDLITEMSAAACVVGYNCKAFDFEILQFHPQRYCDLLLEIVKTSHEYVPLKCISRDFGTRPVLSKVSQMTERWRLSKRTEVITALSRHVGSIRRLHQHILGHGWVLAETREGGTKRVHISLKS